MEPILQPCSRHSLAIQHRRECIACCQPPENPRDTCTLPHLKTISTQFLLHSHILIRAASFVLAVNTGHISVLRRKTCALLRAQTSALLRRKTCAVLRARTCALFRASTKETTEGGRQKPPPSAQRSARIYDSAVFEISDVWFCAQESHNS